MQSASIQCLNFTYSQQVMNQSAPELSAQVRFGKQGEGEGKVERGNRPVNKTAAAECAPPQCSGLLSLVPVSNGRQCTAVA
jgi:hypothetical protein